MNLENINILTKKETNELLKKVVAGDLEARNKLIESNLRFAMYFARKYAKTDLELDEFFSDAVLGLTKAVDTFKEEKIGQISFLTYASTCMKNEILLTLRKRKRKLDKIVNMQDFSVQKNDDDQPITLQEILPSDTPSIISKIILEESFKNMYQAIQHLSEREQYILKRKYGITSWEDIQNLDKYREGYGSKYSFASDKEIAQELKISRSYVTKLHELALLKLKSELTGVANPFDVK